jgi:pimeloyl-ACP methyl ester carboxylesterase
MEAAMGSTAECRLVPTRIGALHVESRGQGDVLFCWPSLYCDARTLDALVDELARDHRVLVVDGPGHGRSGISPGPFSSEDAARAAIEVLDAMDAARVTWIGAAWGGHIGITVARLAPQRLTGLVIMNTPLQPWRGGQFVLMRLAQACLWAFGPRSFVAPILADKMIGRSAGPDRQVLVDAVTAALRRCNREGLLLAARSAMFDREDPLPHLSEVLVPTVYFAGAEDTLYSVEDARRQSAGFPQCRFVVLEHSSHQSALEAPERVLPIIRESLLQWSRAA